MTIISSYQLEQFSRSVEVQDWLELEGFDLDEDIEKWYNHIDRRLYFGQGLMVRSLLYE